VAARGGAWRRVAAPAGGASGAMSRHRTEWFVVRPTSIHSHSLVLGPSAFTLKDNTLPNVCNVFK
jgi:hypothetical protein